MTDSYHQDSEPDLAVLRRQNRSWRSKANKLRRTNRDVQKHSDELFEALCQTDFDAKQALGELWARSGLVCGPEDYREIVARSLEAIGIIRYIAGIASYVPDEPVEV